MIGLKTIFRKPERICPICNIPFMHEKKIIPLKYFGNDYELTTHVMYCSECGYELLISGNAKIQDMKEKHTLSEDDNSLESKTPCTLSVMSACKQEEESTFQPKKQSFATECQEKAENEKCNTESQSAEPCCAAPMGTFLPKSFTIKKTVVNAKKEDISKHKCEEEQNREISEKQADELLFDQKAKQTAKQTVKQNLSYDIRDREDESKTTITQKQQNQDSVLQKAQTNKKEAGSPNLKKNLPETARFPGAMQGFFVRPDVFKAAYVDSTDNQPKSEMHNRDSKTFEGNDKKEKEITRTKTEKTEKKTLSAESGHETAAIPPKADSKLMQSADTPENPKENEKKEKVPTVTKNETNKNPISESEEVPDAKKIRIKTENQEAEIIKKDIEVTEHEKETVPKISDRVPQKIIEKMPVLAQVSKQQKRSVFSNEEKRYLAEYVPHKRIIIDDLIYDTDDSEMFLRTEGAYGFDRPCVHFNYRTKNGNFFRCTVKYKQEDSIRVLDVLEIKRLLQDYPELYKRFFPNSVKEA